ncbi:MAG: hypothetical protein AB7H93_06370 [Vicinamibacterales bacterium]
MPDQLQTSAPVDDDSSVRRRLAEFATGFRQFWEGYWSAPPGAC